MPTDLLALLATAVLALTLMLLWLAVRTRRPVGAAQEAHMLTPTRVVSALPSAPAPLITPSPIAPQGPRCPHCGNPRLLKRKEIWLCYQFPRCTGALSEEIS